MPATVCVVQHAHAWVCQHLCVSSLRPSTRQSQADSAACEAAALALAEKADLPGSGMAWVAGMSGWAKAVMGRSVSPLASRGLLAARREHLRCLQHPVIISCQNSRIVTFWGLHAGQLFRRQGRYRQQDVT